MPRKYGLTKRQLIDEVNTEFEYALNQPGDSIDLRNADAWKRFNRQPMGNEVDDASDVVSSDVREVVTGMLPQFSRTLALADNLGAFTGVGPEDEALADQETKALNHVFWKLVPESWLKTKMWMFSGLMETNAYAEAFWDEKIQVREEEYEGLTLVKYNEMVNQPGWEAVERSEIRRDEDGIDKVDVTFRITQDEGRPNWEHFPRSEMRVSADACSLDPLSGRMCGRERLLSRSELIAMGFQKSQVMKLNPFDFSKSKNIHGDSNTDYAKAQTQEEKTAIKRAENGNDKSLEQILTRKAYIKVDYDGDGIAEIREIWVASDQILRWEEDGRDANRIVTRHPFHVLCAEPHPNQHFGSAPGVNTVMDQDITTTILRQTLDNLYRANEPKQQISEQNLTEDTLDQMNDPGITTVVTATDDPINTLAIPFIAKDSFQFLAYHDAKRAERTGVQANQQAFNAEDLKHVQKSVHEDVKDTSGLKIEDVARTFCETGFKSLLLHLHELMITHDMRAMRVELDGEYLDIDPRQWKSRDDMTIQVGTGMGSREQQVSFLERELAAQMSAFQDEKLRNLIVTPQQIYQTARKLAKLKQLEPDMHWVDPGQELAPPSTEQQQQLDQQAQLLQQAQAALDEEKKRVEDDKRKVDSVDDSVKAKMKEFETQVQHVQEIRSLQDQLREANAKLADSTIQNELAQMELDLKKAKSEDERAEIRSRTAANVAQALVNTSTAQKIKVETNAMRDGSGQMSEEVEAEAEE